AALNLISDQQSIVFARQFVRSFSELTAYRSDAAFTLHKLKTNSADRGVKFALQIGYVIELDKLHSRHNRRKRRAIFFFVRCRQRAKGTAVEGMLQRQNPPFRFGA